MNSKSVDHSDILSNTSQKHIQGTFDKFTACTWICARITQHQSHQYSNSKHLNHYIKLHSLTVQFSVIPHLFSIKIRPMSVCMITKWFQHTDIMCPDIQYIRNNSYKTSLEVFTLQFSKEISFEREKNSHITALN